MRHGRVRLLRRAMTALLLGLLVGSGCGSLRTADQRLQALVGAPSNQLLPIFGAPSDVVQDGDLEVLTYAWVIENTEGTIDRPYFSRIPEVSDRFLVRARCKVRLEVRGGLVTTAEAEGVTTRNGLYRAGCIDAFMARVKTVERAR